MRPDPDLLIALCRAHSEFDPPPVDFRDLGLAGDHASDWCRCEVADIDFGADRAFAGVEIGLDRIERVIAA